MFEAINRMLLDMLAAVARKDCTDRRRRQAQGQAKAKAEGRYKGRPEDAARNDGIARMLAAGQSWGSIQAADQLGFFFDDSKLAVLHLIAEGHGASDPN